MISIFQKREPRAEGLKILNAFYDLAVQDNDISQTAIQLSGEYTEKYKKDVKMAAVELTFSQKDICSDTDSLYDLGKRITIHPAIPPEVAGTLYIQIRMIIALAIMGGYNPQDYLVKTLVFMTLVGMNGIDISKRLGIYIGNKLTVQAVEKCSKKILRELHEEAGNRLVMVLCHDGINVVSKAPEYDGFKVESFDRNSVGMVAERASDLFLY